MTSQMKRTLTRVDGVTSPIEPIQFFGPDSSPRPESPGATRRAREARRRAGRMARTRAGVVSGRVPRALEALLLASDPSDSLIHQDLAAAGLL
jgi:hypothetical protein